MLSKNKIMFTFNLDEKIKYFLKELSNEIYINNVDTEYNKNIVDFRLCNIFNKILKVKFKNLDYKYNSTNKDKMEVEQCIAVLKTGPNKGKLCNKSVYYNKYCKTHSKYAYNSEENKPVNITKEEKNINTQNIQSNKNNEETEEDNYITDEKKILINKEPTVNSKQIVISINKYGNFVFGDTGLVFNNNKIVVAKEGANGIWLTLTNDDIELCKKYKLKYEVIQHNKPVPEPTYSITSQFNIFQSDREF